jgi:aspartyl-tRNA synthetase
MNMNEYETTGYISEIRNFGNLMFIIIRKGYLFEQITFFKKDCPDLYNQAKDLTKETIIKITGEKKDAEKAMNEYEVIPSSLEIISLAKAPVPLDISGKIESTFDARINHRYIDLRLPEHKAIFIVRSQVYKAAVDYFNNNGFINITTPKIVSTGVESGAELFKMDYFGRPAYLSQSPQVYKQMMIVSGFEKVYEIGPVFRAEKSNTTKHTTEFTGIDFEIAHINSLEEIIKITQNIFKHIINHVKENCKKELEILNITLEEPKDFPIIEMSKLKEFLKEKGKVLNEDEDLDTEAEKLCHEISKEKFNSEFLFVTEYPFTARPFYHNCYEDRPNITKSCDLIWKGVEMCTGSLREHRVDVLKKQIQKKGLKEEDLKYYIEMLEYGTPPHGGCGIGLDRIVEMLLNLPNVKEAILLPRDPQRLTP